jgi:hypothetical protein
VYAERIGHRLNRFISINFACSRTLLRAQEIVGHYLRLIGQWLCRRGVAATYVWVLEHVPGTGEHVHILLHCPPELAATFAPKMRSHWLKIVGVPPRAHVFKCRRIGPREQTHLDACTEAQQYRRRLKGILRYLMKGLDPAEKSFLDAGRPLRDRRSTAELLGVRVRENAPIAGRRSSTSENIGKTARYRWALKRAAGLG